MINERVWQKGSRFERISVEIYLLSKEIILSRHLIQVPYRSNDRVSKAQTDADRCQFSSYVHDFSTRSSNEEILQVWDEIGGKVKGILGIRDVVDTREQENVKFSSLLSPNKRETIPRATISQRKMVWTIVMAHVRRVFSCKNRWIGREWEKRDRWERGK